MLTHVARKCHSNSNPILLLSAVRRYSSDLKTVSFVKERSLGLRLVGGNDVGIFVGGVQPHSPAYEQGMKEGDQIMQVSFGCTSYYLRYI